MRELPHLTEIEQANAELDAGDLMVFEQANGRFALYRIERGAAAYGYDRYVRLGSSYPTLAQALAAGRRLVAAGRAARGSHVGTTTAAAR
jgi:hypothetical protein